MTDQSEIISVAATGYQRLQDFCSHWDAPRNNPLISQIFRTKALDNKAALRHLFILVTPRQVAHCLPIFCRTRLFFQHPYGFYQGNKRGVLAASWLDGDNFTLAGTVFGSVSLKLTIFANSPRNKSSIVWRCWQ